MQTKSNTSRKQILDKIVSGKANLSPFPFQEPDWDENIYKNIEEPLEQCFATEIATIDGNCILCSSMNEVYGKIQELLRQKGIENVFCKTESIQKELADRSIPFSKEENDFLDMQAGITYCEALVARTGSVMVSSAHEAGRRVNIYPPVHIVIAKKSQLVPYVGDALELMKARYGNDLPSAITNITGPSRTADIEKTLVLGAHGPKEIWVLLDVSN